MSSDAFVDVTWRGLEVGRRVKLRAIRAGSAYLDHGTPMPVGTVLAIRTDEGVEITATVHKVHEQVGGSPEVPGMHVVPRLEGAAAGWWSARAEPEAPPVAEPVASVAEPVIDVEAQKPTLSMTPDQVAEALAAAARDDAPAPPPTEAPPVDNSSTQVMPAITDEELAAMEAGAGGSNGELVDDGRRTMVMSAIDVDAIVAAASADAAAAEIDDDGPSQDGPSQDGPSQDGSGGDAGRGGNGKKKSKGKRKRR